jgi:Tol biopolymer transport system component
LFTSTTTPNNSTRVNANLLGVGGVLTGPFPSTPPAWAPDSSRIAYVAQQDVAGVMEVYSGLPNGSSTSKISGPLAASGSAKLGVTGEVWSPVTASLTLSYRADQLLFGTDELWATTGTTNPQLTNNPAHPGGLKSFALWAPDGSAVAYVSEQDSATAAELYLSSLDGLTKQKISGPLVAGGNVDPSGFAWAL